LTAVASDDNLAVGIVSFCALMRLHVLQTDTDTSEHIGIGLYVTATGKAQENLVKIVRVVLEICSQTDIRRTRQTDTHTDHDTPHNQSAFRTALLA